MSVVAISQTYGSLGEETGRELAQVLGLGLADREIILEAAERFGPALRELEHVTEERPTLRERLADTRGRYLAFVEAVLFELAAHDRFVLLGRGAPFSLRGLSHVLRVRITAPEKVRARRLGLGLEAGLDAVRRSDRERSSRVQYLYHVDWNDPLLYDLTLSTERLDVVEAVRLVRETLATGRFESSPDSLAEARDLSVAAKARAALLSNRETAELSLAIACRRGIVSLAGHVRESRQRAAAEALVRSVEGVREVDNTITVLPAPRHGI